MIASVTEGPPNSKISARQKECPSFCRVNNSATHQSVTSRIVTRLMLLNQNKAYFH